MARLAKKVALVTAAGSGIGRAIAVHFATEGCDVVVNDLAPEDGNPDTAAETAELSRAASAARGGKAIHIHADVSDRVAVEAMVESAAAQMGRLDVRLLCLRGLWKAAARANCCVCAACVPTTDLRVQRVVLAAGQLFGHGLGVGAANFRGDAVWGDARLPVRGEADGCAG